jgi:plasmid maintenance system antidote protein VapI
VLIENEGHLSQKKIAQMLSIHHETVKHIVHDDLTMRRVNIKWVLYTLNSSQKTVAVQVSRELLDFLESRTNQSFSNVYTGDETWVYLDNPRTSM